MAASRSTILDLPRELLDHIFGFFVWTPDDSLLPSSPDITNISLTCRHLREAVLPTLFRHARLVLRWPNGTVAEPSLFRMRRDAPHLLKLIRCVHVHADFSFIFEREHKPFEYRDALQAWTHASDTAATDLTLQNVAREIAAELPNRFAPAKSLPQEDRDATELLANAFFGIPIRHDRNERTASRELPDPLVDAYAFARNRLQMDALLICMLCLPRYMHTLVFDSLPTDLHHHPQHEYALRVCSTAMRLFHDRLKHVSVVSHSLHVRGGITTPSARDQGDYYTTTLAAGAPSVQALTSLTLASTTERSDRLSRHSLDAIRVSVWQNETMVSNVTHLSLRNLTDKRSALFKTIQSFTSLTDLTISDVRLCPDMRGVGQAQPSGADPMWLLFLVSVRLQRPVLRLCLKNLNQWQEPEALPASAIKWLLTEAVPIGSNVDFERETRLTEDFSSFMSLWMLDDSERGRMARTDPLIGKLVDEAFATSRSQGFANVR